MITLNRVKVFVLYHKQSRVFRSEAYEPLQTGCNQNAPIKGFLHDNDGVNISDKNPWYAELTGNYWVWKNYLPAHPETEYIGFCHYRRNWDFSKLGRTEDVGFVHKMTFSRFGRLFEHQSSESFLLRILRGYDILLPEKWSVRAYNMTNFDAYKRGGHSIPALNAFIDALSRRYSDCEEDTKSFLDGGEGYFCLNYIMRRELFVDFMEWLFPILDDLEERFDWSINTSYATQKSPAYIAERFFNVWLSNLCKKQSIRIIERRMLLLSNPSISFYKQCFVDMLVRFYHQHIRRMG